MPFNASNYTNYKILTTDETLIDSDETNIPIAIHVNADTDVQSAAQADGKDIAFATDEETPTLLNFALIDYDNSTGTAYAFVKMPTLSSSVADTIRMYYGYSGETASLENRDATFPSEYKLAMSLYKTRSGEDALIEDLSGNDNHGATMGTGYYLDSDGVDDYGTVSDHSSLQDLFDGGGQIGQWIMPRSDGGGSLGRIMDKRGSTATGLWTLYTHSESNGFVKLAFVYQMSGAAAQWDTGVTIPLNVPTFVVVDYRPTSTSDTTTDPTIYTYNTLDGFQTLTVGSGLTEITAPSGTRNSDVGDDLTIGNWGGATTRSFDGGLWDQFVISSGNGETLLTAGQLETLAKTGNYGDYTFTSHWKLDESSYGSGIADSGAESNSGTVTGATATQGRLTYSPSFVAEGFGKAMDFEGTSSLVRIPYATELRGGNGSTDDAKTVMAVVNADDATGIRVVTQVNADFSKIGYLFGSLLNDLPFFGIYDNDSSNRQIREDSTTLPINSDIVFATSYSGVGGSNAGAGINVLIDGIVVDDADRDSGTYSAMHEHYLPVAIGGQIDGTYSNGSISLVLMTNDQKDTDYVNTMYEALLNNANFWSFGAEKNNGVYVPKVLIF